MTVDLDSSGSCRFRVLTAPGPGAVAVIELTCEILETAPHMLRRLSFVRPNAQSGILASVPPDNVAPQNAAVSVKGLDSIMSLGRICYGYWNAEDLVVVRTSELTWEIQCHGGTIAVNRICRDLLSDGVLEGDRDTEAVSLATPAASMDAPRLKDVQLIVKQAVRSRVTNARSRRTAGLILAQASNSLCQDLMTILNSLSKDVVEVKAVRQRLAGWLDVADHLTEPWRVVFAGAPNVGKSSLMNMIAGMERSIVCDQPGTTRDIVEVDGVVEGWPFRFVDTAGLREGSEDQIEELGIQQSYLATSQCDVLCLVSDDAGAWHHQLSLMKLPKHTVLVRNKCDLMAELDFVQPLRNKSPALSGLPIIHVSAHTGHGLPELLEWIRRAVVPQEPDKNTALPVCARQFEIG